MSISKASYLKQITSNFHFKSTTLSSDLDGATPPSVFIGSFGYPKVQIGPMIAPEIEGVEIFDTPEDWLKSKKTQEDIISYRLNLVRGKSEASIFDFKNKLVQKIQEISLSDKSVFSHAKFSSIPKGFSFDDESHAHGPSGNLSQFEIDNFYWNKRLETAHYDSDLSAKDAIISLYNDGTKFSQIQKALSTGSFGLNKNRKLVPTRWSITAVDSTLADYFLSKVKYHPVLENFRVYENFSLNNYYAVILIPTFFQYEWIEAFLSKAGQREYIFADFELSKKKIGYSSVGGCYYSAKLASLEALDKMKIQSGVLILREANENYVPLGVFNVRENVKMALSGKFREFYSLRDSLTFVSSRLSLPLSKFIEKGSLLRELLSGSQTTLLKF